MGNIVHSIIQIPYSLCDCPAHLPICPSAHLPTWSQVGTHCHERGDLLFHVLRRCDEIAHTFAADADAMRVAKTTETQREFHYFPGPSIVHSSSDETSTPASASSSTASAFGHSSGSARHIAGGASSASASVSNGMKNGPFPPEWAHAPTDSLEFKAWLLVQQNEALEHRCARVFLGHIDGSHASAQIMPTRLPNHPKRKIYNFTIFQLKKSCKCSNLITPTLSRLIYQYAI